MTWRERLALCLTGHRNFGCLCGSNHWNEPRRKTHTKIEVETTDGTTHVHRDVKVLAVNGVRFSVEYLEVLTHPDPHVLLRLERDGDEVLCTSWVGLQPRDEAR
jgi:hypothetical protein